jgi:hypothetical protein
MLHDLNLYPLQKFLISVIFSNILCFLLHMMSHFYLVTYLCTFFTRLNLIQLKLKINQSHYTPWMRLGGEEVYSSYSFSTSALDGSEWSASRPGRALVPEKGPPVPIVQEAGWAPEPVWTQRLEEKSFAPAGDRTSIARPSSP